MYKVKSGPVPSVNQLPTGEWNKSNETQKGAGCLILCVTLISLSTVNT